MGAVSSVAAIVLILCSRAYKNFFHRLYLYIATSALVLSVCWCVKQAIPIPETDQLGSSVFTIIDLALIGLSSSLIAIFTCWLSFHVFLMVMCGVTSLKKWPFEIAGFILVLVLSLPFTATYIWLLCTFNLSICKGALFAIAMLYLLSPLWFNIGVSIFGVTFISIATVALIIRSFCSTQLNGGVRKFYRQALKAALPFLILQIFWFIFGLVSLAMFFSSVSATYHTIINRLIIIIYLTLPVYICAASSAVAMPTTSHTQPQVQEGEGEGEGRGGSLGDSSIQPLVNRSDQQNTLHCSS